MKQLLIALTLILASSTANAAWYAEAWSNNGMGWGASNSRAQAKHIAMRNCQARTPTWDVCFITTVYWR